MDEFAVFKGYLAGKGLKHSNPRDWILEVFLGMENHVTVDELWAAVKIKYPSVGYATVYRTIKLLCQSGLCSEIRFEDGTSRYEHLFGHNHHDHLICIECGRCIEVFDEEIEALQDNLMKKQGFVPQYHRMNLYGTCKNCLNKK
jgi:Fur family transcriptional regulator, ferric uptake regulator